MTSIWKISRGELIRAEGVAADEDGDVLVWIGAAPVPSSKPVLPAPVPQAQVSLVERLQVPSQDSELRTSQPLAPNAQHPAERRQLTVMFCDLVGSTALSAQLDPEELHEVVRAYQETSTGVVRRYDGYIAQHLGDGLLVYFGYPAAHEDDAVRAVRTGLEIVEKVHTLRTPSPVSTGEGRGEGQLQVRIGIHTGLVVIADIGSSEKREILALGETPNLAARLQSLAEPDTVVISAATYRLIEGLFTCENRGQPELKGVATPLTVYRVVRGSEAQSRFEVAVQAGLTPFVGRDLELGLLRERWTQAEEGAGQVVLLSGEPGIGKSRLVQELKNVVMQAGAVRIEYRCSAYHQNSAFYPLVEHLQRVLHFTPGDTPQDKLCKLEQMLSRYRFPQNDTMPLLASLLSLPPPEGSSSLSLTPQQQKQKTLDVLVRWLFEETEQAPVYAVWEDLHWVDPSTLEFLTVCLDQTATARMLMVLTGRPEFTPTWASRSHISHLVLSRLGQQQSSAIVEGVVGGKPLPREVVQQIANKTDGVPLFVEELTKMVVESGLVREVEGRYELNGPLPPLAIPSTLQDSLMARLDRLASVRDIAQMGTTIGREFTYELLRAVSPLNEESLQQGLKQLVDAELVYQSGLPPQARYLFKHALVQDTAYQSLLKSRRQQLHQQVARVLEEQFPQTVETQPELVAYHYTEAGLAAQAIPYWQQAGQRASQRSAATEAERHLTTALALLNTLPDFAERTQQELTLQTALGTVLLSTKGFAAPEVEQAYRRAWELCQQVGETPQLFPVLYGLWIFSGMRGDLQTAFAQAQHLLTLAQRAQDTAPLVTAHWALGFNLGMIGNFAQGYEILKQGATLYVPEQHRSLADIYGFDPGGGCLNWMADLLWFLGYPEQARQTIARGLTLARGLVHPSSLCFALVYASYIHFHRHEWQLTQEHAEAVIGIATEHEFPHWVQYGQMVRGYALAYQGRAEEGIAEIYRGLAGQRAAGTEAGRSVFPYLLAAAYGQAERFEEGLNILTEALAFVDRTEERFYEAELYRLRGELTLKKSSVRRPVSEVPNTQHPTPSIHAEVEREAEECFLKAIEVARRQRAKSWELRAATSLARLWQQQGKKQEAHQMLADIYNWFTEGFDTKDLQEAKALLEELSH